VNLLRRMKMRAQNNNRTRNNLIGFISGLTLTFALFSAMTPDLAPVPKTLKAKIISIEESLYSEDAECTNLVQYITLVKLEESGETIAFACRYLGEVGETVELATIF
jgi:hypothetical protein